MRTTGHSGYLRRVFNPEDLKAMVERVNDKLLELQDKGASIDAIAFRGQSGAGMAYPLSAIHGWRLICVRKPSVDSHGRYIEAVDGDVFRYVIVDDLIATGQTIHNIVNALSEATCVGIILYDPGYQGDTWDGIPVYKMEQQ
jgi:adenine/guanine phosphoribosyltransferase-like PRPP-binding protein